MIYRDYANAAAIGGAIPAQEGIHGKQQETLAIRPSESFSDGLICYPAVFAGYSHKSLIRHLPHSGFCALQV